MIAKEMANDWYDKFSRFAEDLYPGRYTWEFTRRLAEMGEEIIRKAKEKNSTIVVHNYLYPEFHEIATKVGDSLGLSHYVRDMGAKRVDFQSVYFMGETAKIITGDNSRIYVPDYPQILGCSLVFGTDYEWIKRWKEVNSSDVVVSYINSTAYLKSLSKIVSTSRNTEAILKYAVKTYPGKKVLFGTDKFLGMVMRAKAGLSPDIVDVYNHKFGGFNACCYVHEQVAPDILEILLAMYPDAVLLIHPECGCASVCLYKVEQGIIPHDKSYFVSTEQMVTLAKTSSARRFIVATEKGMIYRLRKEVPNKEFIPMSDQSDNPESFVCKYMKSNTFEKLLRSLNEDRLEIVFCDDCCDPKNPYQDGRVIHIQKSIAQKAKTAIELGLSIF